MREWNGKVAVTATASTSPTIFLLMNPRRWFVEAVARFIYANAKWTLNIMEFEAYFFWKAIARRKKCNNETRKASGEQKAEKKEAFSFRCYNLQHMCYNHNIQFSPFRWYGVQLRLVQSSRCGFIRTEWKIHRTPRTSWNTSSHSFTSALQLIMQFYPMKNDTEIIILLSWSDNSFPLYICIAHTHGHCGEIMCIIRKHWDRNGNSNQRASFFHSIENLHAPIKNQYEKIS